MSVYFDNNAITPMSSVVKEAMIELMDEAYNPSSIHSFGRRARTILDTARARLASALKASSDYSIVFTASATESNNLAIRGMSGYKVITSAIEHPSVLKTVGSGVIPVDENGLVDLEVLQTILAAEKGKILVSIQAANSETGVIQPLKKICEIVHRHGGVFHTDAVQAFGKIPFSLADVNADMVTISSHKVGGSTGASALILRKNIALTPIMLGGAQESRLRPGTQNIIAIHGFGIAAEMASGNLAAFSGLRSLVEYLETAICRISYESVIFSKGAPRLPNTSSFSMPYVSNETQLIHFDINGYAVSAGSACSSGRVDLPYVQMSMGYSEEVARNAIRVSLGLENTLEQVKGFVKLWKELYLKSIKIAA